VNQYTDRTQEMELGGGEGGTGGGGGARESEIKQDGDRNRKSQKASVWPCADHLCLGVDAVARGGAGATAAASHGRSRDPRNVGHHANGPGQLRRTQNNNT
jgi:hypothetical protein